MQTKVKTPLPMEKKSVMIFHKYLDQDCERVYPSMGRSSRSPEENDSALAQSNSEDHGNNGVAVHDWDEEQGRCKRHRGGNN